MLSKSCRGSHEEGDEVTWDQNRIRLGIDVLG